MRSFRNEKGGVALEYVLVTTFATLATTILLAVLAGITKEKVAELADKLEVDVDYKDFDKL